MVVARAFSAGEKGVLVYLGDNRLPGVGEVFVASSEPAFASPFLFLTQPPSIAIGYPSLLLGRSFVPKAALGMIVLSRVNRDPPSSLIASVRAGELALSFPHPSPSPDPSLTSNPAIGVPPLLRCLGLQVRQPRFRFR